MPAYNTAAMSISRPTVPLLDKELGGLAWKDVKRMALHLDDCMTGAVLDDIEHDNVTATDCKIAAMSEWLKRDSTASWDKVVSALQTVSMCAPALKIKNEYCMPSTQPQASETGNVCPAVISPQPPSESAPVDTVSQDNSVDGTDSANFQAITEEVAQLQEKFVAVLTHTESYFKKKSKKSRIFQKRFQDRLTTLSLSKKNHIPFLKKEKDHITKAKDTDKIFCILAPYWNYIDYAFLDYLIKEFDIKELQEELERYVAELEQFERKTIVQDFDLAVQDQRVLPSHFKTVTHPLFKDPAICSLFDVHQFKNEVVGRSTLSRYTVYLHGVRCTSSSGEIVLACPPEACAELCKVLNEGTRAKVSRDHFKKRPAHSMGSLPATKQGGRGEPKGRRCTAPTINVQKVRSKQTPQQPSQQPL